ncbi:alpha-hydroxy-acid oxidizing protein [Actinoallomurus liliacearum]
MLIVTLWALPVGGVAALAALGLLRLVALITDLVFYGRPGTALLAPGLHPHPWWLPLSAPIAGGLIVGLMARYGSEKIRGHGMPEAIEAILTGGSASSGGGATPRAPGTRTAGRLCATADRRRHDDRRGGPATRRRPRVRRVRRSGAFLRTEPDNVISRREEERRMYADFQFEIYLNGLNDVRPPLPTDLTRLEALAREKLPREAYDYVAGSAGTGDTAVANREAFRRRRIVPRMLRGAAGGDLTTQVLGTDLPAPVLLGPVGVLNIVHPEGELAAARAARALGVPVVLSTAASHTLEEVAEVAGPRWYQLYWPGDRDLAVSLLGRARAAGYTALVVTLDTFTLAWRPYDLDNAYLPFLRRIGIQNYLADPVFTAKAGDDPVLHWAGVFGNPGLTWDDLAFLREHWDGPIALKGIQATDDARRAVDAGMDGIVVSNHGGRQVDGAVAALDTLPIIAHAVDDQIEVLFDSGVRTGADVFKALALGAKAVLLGRPYVYGLALDGEDGVRHVLRCLLAELELTLRLSGHDHVATLSSDDLHEVG